MDRMIEQIPRFFTATNIGLLAEAAYMTLAITIVGCLIGFGLAFVLVFLRQTPGLWALPLRIVCVTYVEFFRRIPFLVIVYLVLFFIQAITPNASLFSIAVIAICLYAIAYTADIIRGGLESVPHTQIEAARAMNLSRFQTTFMVVLPQAWPVIIPPSIAFAVSFIKDTALVSQIGVFELTFRGKELNNQGYSGVLVFGTIAFCYFILSFPLTLLANIWRNGLLHLGVNDVRAKYGKLEVLRGVSLSVRKGEISALVGPSGSGKSTVLRALVGLTPITDGNVEIAGQVIDYKSTSSVRAARDTMAIVFQQYNLFQNMTVMGNVTFAPIKIKRRPAAEVEAQARQLLDLVGLADKYAAYPDELSGGQQQRVAIARALALEPKILLLDEVTSALDPELVTEVLDTIRRLAAEGMTMIIVSHEMAFVREVANQVVFMDRGEVVESGAPAELLDHPKTDRARDFFSKILRH